MLLRLSLRVGLAAVTLLAMAAMPPAAMPDNAPLPSFDRVMLQPAPKPIADFELTDQDGRSFRFSSLRGEPALMLFGFAHCPDVCPASLQKLEFLKRSHPELKRCGWS